jgi:hypothetical protein
MPLPEPTVWAHTVRTVFDERTQLKVEIRPGADLPEYVEVAMVERSRTYARIAMTPEMARRVHEQLGKYLTELEETDG